MTGGYIMTGTKKPQTSRIVAFIDIGTNSIRLFVVRLNPDCSYIVLTSQKEAVRLGEGEFETGFINGEAMDRAVMVAGKFVELAHSFRAEEFVAVATSATREAQNRYEFLSRLRKESHLDVQVISGREEARLIFMGVTAAMHLQDEQIMTIDIGGGSTELLLADGETILATVSTGLGAVKLTESCLHGDPPLPAELEGVRRTAAERLDRARSAELRDVRSPDAFVGTAGTVTSLAAIDLALVPYDPVRVTGHRLTRVRVAQLLDRLASLPVADRRRVPGLEPARADIIVAGVVICLAAMDSLGFSALTVSDGGLREGILLDLLRRRC